MSGLLAPWPLAQTAIALALGMLLGLVHFASLHRITDFYAGGKAFKAVCLQLGRFVLLAAVLVAAARFGVLPLLACAIGLLVGRWLVLKRARRAR